MAETPGLGDKIIKDPGFQENFNQLDAQLNPRRTALLNPIVTVKHGSKQETWEVDAISGATISSKAVGKALNESAQSLLPKLHPLIRQLEANGT
jgi:electron transport complex protein RnfG